MVMSLYCAFSVFCEQIYNFRFAVKQKGKHYYFLGQCFDLVTTGLTKVIQDSNVLFYFLFLTSTFWDFC